MIGKTHTGETMGVKKNPKKTQEDMAKLVAGDEAKKKLSSNKL